MYKMPLSVRKTTIHHPIVCADLNYMKGCVYFKGDINKFQNNHKANFKQLIIHLCTCISMPESVVFFYFYGIAPLLLF